MDSATSLPDLVKDSKVETYITGNITKHIFYESGESLDGRRKQRVEYWEREHVLGQGAYGIVYRERRQQQDETQGIQKKQEGGAGTSALRAIKQISKSGHAGENLDYERELEAITKFSHANYSHCFVRSYGWFESSESIFIIMEFIQHGDLQKLLKDPLPESEAMGITGQLLEGLSFMHSSGFVHRDLKPSNIMAVSTSPEWFVKIADFGISKRRQQGVTTLHTLQRGTIGFAAPEVLGVSQPPLPGNSGTVSSSSYTLAVDLWSLGAVLYYMMTLQVVFENAADIVMYAMGLRAFPEAALQSRSVSASAQSFIRTLLTPDPGARPTVGEAVQDRWLGAYFALKAGLDSGGAATEACHGGPGTLATGVSLASAMWSEWEDEAQDGGVETSREPPASSQDTTYRSPYAEEVPDEDTEVQSASREALPLQHAFVLESMRPMSQSRVPSIGQLTLRAGAGTRSPSAGVQRQRVDDPDDDIVGLDSSACDSDIDDRSTISRISVKSNNTASAGTTWPSQRTTGQPSARQWPTSSSPSPPSSPSYPSSSTIFSGPSTLTLGTLSIGRDMQLANELYKMPSLLNMLRETLYIRKLTRWFVDERGKIWFAPEPLEMETGADKLATIVSEVDVKMMEQQGFLKRLSTDDKIEPWGSSSSPISPLSTLLKGASSTCYICCRQALRLDGLYRLPCGHLHCHSCLQWAWKFAATDAGIPFPSCCTQPVPFPIFNWGHSNNDDDQNDRMSSALTSESSAATHNFECCGKAFSPSYTLRSPTIGEWVVFCPRCSKQLCFVCAGPSLETQYHESLAFGCSFRATFRADFARLLMDQDPSGTVLYSRTVSEPPGIRLDCTEALIEYSAKALARRDRTEVDELLVREAVWLPDQDTLTAEDLETGELSINCRQCGASVRSKAATGKAATPRRFKLLRCGHVICYRCVLAWLAIGLVSPPHLPRLCSRCPTRIDQSSSGSDNDDDPYRDIPSGFDFRDGPLKDRFTECWDDYGLLRRAMAWRCTAEGHSLQKLSYSVTEPMSWRQTCSECQDTSASAYCIRCGLSWHAHDCAGYILTRDFLDLHGRDIVDQNTISFVKHALSLETSFRDLVVDTA